MMETQIAVALRPLITMFYLFGFDLNEHQTFRSIQRIYSTICYSLQTTASIVYIYMITKSFTLEEWDIGTINQIVHFINFDVVNIFLINTALYVLSWNGMADLWKALHQLEEFHSFDGQFYRTIRRRSWMAVFYVSVIVSAKRVKTYEQSLNYL